MNARAEVRYRVTVAPSRTQPGTLEYDLARMVRAGDLLPAHLAALAGSDEIVPEPLAHLTTPPCKPDLARYLAWTWLVQEVGVQQEIAYLDMDWRDEPIEPVREASGVGGRYAEHIRSEPSGLRGYARLLAEMLRMWRRGRRGNA